VGTDDINWMSGNDADNVLTGLGGGDTLLGNGGNDTLRGGVGADKLTGGAGADVFVYSGFSESTVDAKGRDTIMDFSHAQGDLIDLSKIDANAGDAGEGAFKLMAAFDGTHGALTVTAQGSQWLISADYNGDKIADFAILVTSSTALVAADFVL